MVRLPGGPDGAKVGLDDYLLAHGADAFRELLAAAQPPAKPTDDRPEVLVSVLEYVTVEQAVKALAKGSRVDLYRAAAASWLARCTAQAARLGRRVARRPED